MERSPPAAMLRSDVRVTRAANMRGDEVDSNPMGVYRGGAKTIRGLNTRALSQGAAHSRHAEKRRTNRHMYSYRNSDRLTEGTCDPAHTANKIGDKKWQRTLTKTVP